MYFKIMSLWKLSWSLGARPCNKLYQLSSCSTGIRWTDFFVESNQIMMSFYQLSIEHFFFIEEDHFRCQISIMLLLWEPEPSTSISLMRYEDIRFWRWLHLSSSSVCPASMLLNMVHGKWSNGYERGSLKLWGETFEKYFEAVVFFLVSTHLVSHD